ncbi:hypothetical protein EDEG_00749 [Edhazardia aedis USNM 41457]|uniref:Uncharacterized protein n=1 Tax=Edhazardia aedis (strain USNM 41457) TaxID=1003232 RepID=J8ZZV1_EDHAE|nr:hypothetical protein EDEG_00749 [Edhazardia aedis USNM 41457]|eukprot:EJW05168.1 hypothetical protein EDEG_00749 [Edhazardia aedis USNM 41457]
MVFYKEVPIDVNYKTIKVKERIFYKSVNTQNSNGDISLAALEVDNDNSAAVRLMAKTSMRKECVYKKNSLIKKKRYSDQFKDPLFIQKDTYRKLKMIEKFSTQDRNIESMIEKYKDSVSQCIFILKNEFNLPAKEVFTAFDLKKYGYTLEDFNSEEESHYEHENE